MNFGKTGREFTLSLRTDDAVSTDPLLPSNITSGQPYSSTWKVRLRELFPADIIPNSVYTCTHSFQEATGYGSFLRDLGNSCRQTFVLSSNLPRYSSYSYNFHEVQGDPFGILVDNSNSVTFNNGYINTMSEPISAGNIQFYVTIIPYNTYMSGYLNNALYCSPPNTFEVFSPENFNEISIYYHPSRPGPTYQDLCTDPSFFGFGLTSSADPTVTLEYNYTPSVLPPFWGVQQNIDPDNNRPDGTNSLVPVNAPRGVHTFKFKLKEQEPGSNFI